MLKNIINWAKDVLKDIKKIAKALFDGTRGSHDWEHTLRVCRLCERIGSVEGVDMDVLLVAAYLHDIGRASQDASNGAVCHAQKGAKMAESVIDKLPLSENQKENVTIQPNSDNSLKWARQAPPSPPLERAENVRAGGGLAGDIRDRE